MRLPIGFISTVRPVLSSRAMLVVLGALLAVDLLLMLLHSAHVLIEYRAVENALSNPRFSIEKERSYAEFFEYTKTAICVVALTGCWARTRQPVYAALAGVFAFVLLDSAFELHEITGWKVSGAFAAAEGAFEHAPQALGELLFFGVVAVALLALALHKTAGEHRVFGLALLLLILALGGFGAGVDMLHAVLSSGSRRMVDRLFGFLEDGGELAILSVACALCSALPLRVGVPSASARTSAAIARPRWYGAPHSR